MDREHATKRKRRFGIILACSDFHLHVIVTLTDPFLYDHFYMEHTFIFSYIDIRLTQRNGRKTITLLHGLPSDLDPKKILKAFKKEFACNGHIEVEEDYGECIKLQGDHRAKIQTLLIEEGICGKDEIQVHGF